MGHVIVVEPEFLRGREAWVLAHELSHTRQHDWLGPTYLAVHASCQIFSVLVALLHPRKGYPPQHAYNPLERRLLCVPFDALAGTELPSGDLAREVLVAFGLAPAD